MYKNSHVVGHIHIVCDGYKPHTRQPLLTAAVAVVWLLLGGAATRRVLGCSTAGITNESCPDPIRDAGTR